MNRRVLSDFVVMWVGCCYRIDERFAAGESFVPDRWEMSGG